MIDVLIKYKQWVSTDRSNLEEHEDDFDDFLVKLTSIFFELTENHFIAKKQSEFLRVKMASLKFIEAVLILDLLKIIHLLFIAAPKAISGTTLRQQSISLFYII